MKTELFVGTVIYFFHKIVKNIEYVVAYCSIEEYSFFFGQTSKNILGFEFLDSKLILKLVVSQTITGVIG